MITYLDGFAPLQNKILLYCLSSNTAAIMKPIVTQMEERRETAKDINCETAWRCIEETPDSIDVAIKKAQGFTFMTHVVSLEMELARLEIPGSNLTKKNEIDINLRMAKRSLFGIIYNRLSSPDKYGTPTGNLMRKYMSNLFMRGLYLRGNETMWCRFSDYTVLYRNRDPITNTNNPRILEDLNQALQKRKEEYEIRMASGNWEDDFF